MAFPLGNGGSVGVRKLTPTYALLGAVASDITGFGVAWGLALLQGRVNS